MCMVLLSWSIELTGSIQHNNKEAFSTQNEAFSTKYNNDMYTLWDLSWAPCSRNIQIMALLWHKHCLHLVLLIGSSSVLINIPWYASLQISDSQHMYCQILSTLKLTQEVTQLASKPIRHGVRKHVRAKVGAIISHINNFVVFFDRIFSYFWYVTT